MITSTMKFEDLPTYQDIIQDLTQKNRQKHLLFGNGFSMAYDSEIFSYNALSEFVEKTGDEFLKILFSKLNTKNFELIMQQLDNFVEVAKVFNADDELIEKINRASIELKQNLIEAVKALHPNHVFEIPEEQSSSCFNFLKEYLEKNGKVFSTNYDLLLYWVLMRHNSNLSTDGFGQEFEGLTDSFEPTFSDDLTWGKYKETQNVFYLHGTLPFFDNGTDIIKETYRDQHYLLQNISERIDNKEYPIFVTAGTAKEKLIQIMHNKYLSFCYDELSSIKGSLVVIGFNFGEYDTHIIDAINKAAHQGSKGGENDLLLSIKIGLNSQRGLDNINKLIADKRFKCRKVTTFNAKTANIWNNHSI